MSWLWGGWCRFYWWHEIESLVRAEHHLSCWPRAEPPRVHRWWRVEILRLQSVVSTQIGGLLLCIVYPSLDITCRTERLHSIEITEIKPADWDWGYICLSNRGSLLCPFFLRPHFKIIRPKVEVPVA